MPGRHAVAGRWWPSTVCTGRSGVRDFPPRSSMSRTYRGPIQPRSSSARVYGRSGRHQGPVLGGAPSFHFRTHFRYAWACGSCGGAPDTGAREASRLPRFRVGGPPKQGRIHSCSGFDFGRLVRPHMGKHPLLRAREVAVKLGDRVRIRPAGSSVFSIVDVDDDGRFVIESVDGIPEGYRFPMREEDLIPE